MLIPYLIFVLAGVFVAAAIPKLYSSTEFMKTLYGIGIPHRYRHFAAVAIPITELAISFLLLIPATRDIGNIGLLLLLLSFIVITVKAIVQKKRIKCNCFGSIMPSELGWTGLIRLMILMAMSIYVLIGQDINSYDRPIEETFNQITASIGILFLYAMVSKLANNWTAIRKGKV